MNASRCSGGIGLCFVVASLVTFAQQPQPQRETATPANSSRLVLDVVVTNKGKKPVAGLQAEDFVVLDNKKPQKVLSFTATPGAEATATKEPPAEILLLVDEVNARFNRVAYERDEIKKFAMQNGGKLKHPVSIAFFTDHGSDMATGTTTDGNVLLSVFDQHESSLREMRRSEGFYGGVDRFELSLATLNSLAVAEAKQPGRKLVVWISPGWWYLSGPEMDLTRKQEQGLFNSIMAISDELNRARITLYSIDPLGVADAGGLRVMYYEEFLKPVTKINDVQIGNLALQVLATHSGGLALNSSNDIAAQIDRCVDDADAYYTLVIDKAPAEKPNEFHSIEVKVGTPGLVARTQYGYYAQP